MNIPDKSVLNKKQVYLYGDMDCIRQFIGDYAGKIPISKVVSDHENDIRLQMFQDNGIPTISMKEAEEDPDAFFFLCNCFVMGKRRLEYSGKTEYRDFASSLMAEALYCEKKVMLLMGTSLMCQIYQRLRVEQEITSGYSPIFIPDDWLLQPYGNKLEEYLHISRCCRAYICSSTEKKRYRSKKLLPGRLPECETYISVADYGFRGYFPTVDPDRDYISDYFMREHEREKRVYELLVCAREDQFILRECLKGVDDTVIHDHLMGDALLSKEFIRDHFEKELLRWEELERNDTVKLSGFIREYYRDCLCPNLDEWSTQTVEYICQEIADIMGIRLQNDPSVKEAGNPSGTELPIWPVVADVLNLKPVSGRKFRIVTFRGSKELDLSAYAYYLIRYMKASMDLMKYTGMGQNLQKRDKKVKPVTNILEYLEKAAWEHTNQEGLVDERESLTYRQIKLRGQSIGAMIYRAGLSKEHVAVLIRREIYAVTAFFGILYSGNSFYPLDPDLPDDSLKVAVEEAGVMGFVADTAGSERIRRLFPDKALIEYEKSLTEPIDPDVMDRIRDSVKDTDTAFLFCPAEEGNGKRPEKCAHRDYIDNDKQQDCSVPDVRDVRMEGAALYRKDTLFEVLNCIREGILLSWDCKR